MNAMGYTEDERAIMLDRMQYASNVFYSHATRAGCHAFLEFCGLMNEFIKLCHEANKTGDAWIHANVHGAGHLPFRPHHIDYLREKLECIYGVPFAPAAEGRA